MSWSSSQVGLGGVLLNLPLHVMAALIALAFYTWGGAVDAIRGGASGGSWRQSSARSC